MRITPVQRFRDGRAAYEPGQECEVADLDGARYVGNGWATSPDYSVPGAVPAGQVQITPHSVTHQATTSLPKQKKGH